MIIEVESHLNLEEYYHGSINFQNFHIRIIYYNTNILHAFAILYSLYLFFSSLNTLHLIIAVVFFVWDNIVQMVTIIVGK